MTNFTLSSMRRFSTPLSLFAKCKCENSHRSDMEKGGNHGSPLVHRHNALSTSTPAPLHHKALERPLNVVVGRVLAEGVVGQIGSSLKERICNLFVHGRMVQRGFGFFNSHFPSPDSFVYVATVAAGSANKNVRGETA